MLTIIITIIIIIIIIITNITNNDALWIWITFVSCLSPWLKSESELFHHLSESFAPWLRYASIDRRQSDCIPSPTRQS